MKCLWPEIYRLSYELGPMHNTANLGNESEIQNSVHAQYFYLTGKGLNNKDCAISLLSLEEAHFTNKYNNPSFKAILFLKYSGA